MVKSASLGLSRVGENRAIPHAVEQYLAEEIEEKELLNIAYQTRIQNWKIQKKYNIDYIPSGDFSLCDHVLDTTIWLGNIPRRFYWEGGKVPLSIYFAMIHGQQREKLDAKPMAIKRWFNTSYFYVAPEIDDTLDFCYSDSKFALHYREAKTNLDLLTRPAILGPISYLKISNIVEEDEEMPISKLSIVDEILPVYEVLFQNFKRLKIEHVQIDEPILTTDLTREEQIIFKECYQKLFKYADGINIHLVASHGSVDSNMETIMSLQTQSIHFDLVNGRDNIDNILSHLPNETSLSLGLVDAGSYWINDLNKSIDIAQYVVDKIGSDRVIVGPSSSMFLCPTGSSKNCKSISQDQLQYVAFTEEKLREISIIACALNKGKQSVAAELNENAKLVSELSSIATKINQHNETIRPQEGGKRANYKKRFQAQEQRLSLPKMAIDINGGFNYIDDQAKAKVDKKNTGSKSTDKKTQKLSSAIKWQEKCLVDIISVNDYNKDGNFEDIFNAFSGLSTIKDVHIQHFTNHTYNPTIMHDVLEKKSEPYLVDEVKLAIENCSSAAKKISILGPITCGSYLHLPPGVDRQSLEFSLSSFVIQELCQLQDAGASVIHIDETAMLQNVPFSINGYSERISHISKIMHLISSYVNNETMLQVSFDGFDFEEDFDALSYFDFDALILDTSRYNSKIFESIGYKYQGMLGLSVFDGYSNRITTKADVILAVKKARSFLEDSKIIITTEGNCKKRDQQSLEKSLSMISSVVSELRKQGH